MKEPCELYIKIVLHHLKNCLKDKSLPVYQKNLWIFVTEIFKNGLKPEIMKNSFSILWSLCLIFDVTIS